MLSKLRFDAQGPTAALLLPLYRGHAWAVDISIYECTMSYIDWSSVGIQPVYFPGSPGLVSRRSLSFLGLGNLRQITTAERLALLLTSTLFFSFVLGRSFCAILDPRITSLDLM